MKKNILSFFLFLFSLTFFAQTHNPVIEKIISEVYSNSQLEILDHELMDDIGPRLVGTPQMNMAHDWAVEKYKYWGIEAENQQWGEWRGWERGITHIDMVHPRIQTLAGTQLAWSPSTPKKGITAEVIILPQIADSLSFQKWLPEVKGKFVMIAMNQPTGRPDYDWEKWATPESFEKMKSERDEQTREWNENLRRTGYSKKELAEALEKAGAAGIVDSYWSRGFGTNKIFGAHTKKIPTVDIHLEDYTMLYRMAEHGDRPKIKVTALSKE